MATGWQDLASELVEVLSSRVRKLLSSGINFLATEFGLEISFKPELYPSWVILSTTCMGLLLVVVLSWLMACGRLRSKKRSSVVPNESNIKVIDSPKPQMSKITKIDDQKKKNKKKPADKKVQPNANGRTVPEPQAEIKVTEEAPKQQPDKADKAKKNKKKPKPEVKQNQGVVTLNGKELDEGAWETKISNREKRQQRKREKGSNDGSGSPGRADRPSHQAEQSSAPAPVSTKKNKAASANWKDANSINGGTLTNQSVKLSTQKSTSKAEKWPTATKTSGHKNPEPVAWGQESEGSWTGVNRRLKTELQPVNFSMLGLNPSGGEPVTQNVPDLQWDTPATADNEWSGFNGLADNQNSDWNAPTEPWVNYEPTVETAAPAEVSVSQPPGLQESDDNKEQGDATGNAKSKRKRKKKKKPEGESAGEQVSTSSVSPPEGTLLKSPSLVQKEEPLPQMPATKQIINVTSMKKPEQNTEPPKQAQRKKSRKET
ncbi:metadherin a [Chanos chanos]|uniref:Protein LYRIC n=1 Tax=Chanos chanos TaxID=29144 RepID=A0A6J2WP10_CHACN|nr:protein LYRIC [Chanos chanos]XP_030645081.1 protein LYRIC [Chanos chanos]